MSACFNTAMMLVQFVESPPAGICCSGAAAAVGVPLMQVGYGESNGSCSARMRQGSQAMTSLEICHVHDWLVLLLVVTYTCCGSTGTGRRMSRPCPGLFSNRWWSLPLALRAVNSARNMKRRNVIVATCTNGGATNVTTVKMRVVHVSRYGRECSSTRKWPLTLSLPVVLGRHSLELLDHQGPSSCCYCCTSTTCPWQPLFVVNP